MGLQISGQDRLRLLLSASGTWDQTSALAAATAASAAAAIPMQAHMHLGAMSLPIPGGLGHASTPLAHIAGGLLYGGGLPGALGEPAISPLASISGGPPLIGGLPFGLAIGPLAASLPGGGVPLASLGVASSLIGAGVDHLRTAVLPLDHNGEARSCHGLPDHSYVQGCTWVGEVQGAGFSQR